MLFQSFGSQYNFRKSISILFARGSDKDRLALKKKLSEKYSGKAILFSKGRAALSEAIRLSTSNSTKKQVIITGFTCYSVVQAVRAAGCKELYIDINYEDLNFNFDKLKEATNKYNDIGAIVIQNSLGIPTSKIKNIEDLAKEKGIKIIEDLAHCAGGRYDDGREIGTIGDYVMLSFGRGKSLDAVNGGALIIKNEEDAYYNEPMKPSSHNVRDRWYPIICYISRKTFRIGLGKLLLAFCYKTGFFVRSADGDINIDKTMTNWQSKVVLRELNDLDRVTDERDDRSNTVISLIKGHSIPGKNSIKKSLIRIPIIMNNKREIIDKMSANHIYIDDTWYYPVISPERFYKFANYNERDCPIAVDISKRLINLPTYISINTKSYRKAIEIINDEK
jgi:dTDP-4-amino-4,6-dideoxygalactose transaminase